MSTLEIPERKDARIIKAPIEVSTGSGDSKVEETFEAELPKTLADAVAMEGERDVFRRYINAYVIYLQGQKRAEIAARSGTKEPRKRAKYLEDLGL